MIQSRSIIWRRSDMPGHEFARISRNRSGWSIEGTTILVYRSDFCKMDYSISCDNVWKTKSAKVNGFVGDQIIAAEILVDEQNNWKLNGHEVPEVRDCLDIDLNFSPVTNTLPIHRLNLAVSEKATVRAAWLRFPSFLLEPLEQVYERTAERKYRYESNGGSFQADLEIDDTGIVVSYANLWQIER